MTDSLPRLPSLSVFFPAYNDGGTIGSMVLSALTTLPLLTDDFEVIVVNDGSSDYTAAIVDELARQYPRVRVIHHAANKGYGGALRSGFAAATKEWVFYTDGDAQYDPRELLALAAARGPDTDVVNGYKIARRDPLHRVLIGAIFRRAARVLYGLRIRDVNCDFRLIRRSLVEQVALHADSGAICVEMVRKLQDAGAEFAEAPVHHYPRVYGRSQIFGLRRMMRILWELARLWRKRALFRGSARGGVVAKRPASAPR